MRMNQKIEFISTHHRLPFSIGEKLFLVALSIAAIIALVVFREHYSHVWYLRLGVPLITVFALVSIYFAIKSSLQFRTIYTGFPQSDNVKIVALCLKHLQLEPFHEVNYPHVFVCFVHDARTGQREEIYLVAKDAEVLIHSTINQDSEGMNNPSNIVDKVGMSIFVTSKQLREGNF